MFFASLVIRSISAQYAEQDLPHCDKTVIVDHFQSQIINKRLWNNYTWCIKTVANGDYDGTDLAVVFNNIGTAKVSMYLKGLTEDLYTSYEMPSNKNGGAYFHKKSGLITFSSDKDLLISIGFTTFNGECTDRLITNKPSYSRSVRSDTEGVYCIFNAMPGAQRIEASTNSSYINYYALLYPRYPSYRDMAFHSFDVVLDQSSAVFAQYKVEHYKRKTSASIKISGDRFRGRLCQHWVSELSEPQFLTSSIMLAISAGAISGIVIAITVVLVGLVFIILLNCSYSCRKDIEEWLLAPCECNCRKPTGFDTIVEYSYSE